MNAQNKEKIAEEIKVNRDVWIKMDSNRSY